MKKQTVMGIAQIGIGVALLVACSSVTHAAPPRFLVSMSVSTQKMPTRHVAGAAVWDSKRERVVLFQNLEPRDKPQRPGLVSYDPKLDRFETITTVGEAPSGVGYPAMVYDAKRDALYLFGGWPRDGKGPMDESWTFPLGEGKPKSWQKIDTGKVRPRARNGAVMVVDEVGDRLILHGGDGGTHPVYGYIPLDDLWSFDLVAGHWEQLKPIGAASPARWAFDANGDWTQTDPGGPAPTSRWNHCAAIDHATRTLFIYGGVGYTKNAQLIRDRELYALNLKTLAWSKHPQGTPAPDSRQGATLTFDSSKNVLLLHGGLRNSDTGPSGTSSVWVYDLGSSSWFEARAVDKKLRRSHSTVFDPVGRQHIVLGGQTSVVRGNHYARGVPLNDVVLISLDTFD